MAAGRAPRALGLTPWDPQRNPTQASHRVAGPMCVGEVPVQETPSETYCPLTQTNHGRERRRPTGEGSSRDGAGPVCSEGSRGVAWPGTGWSENSVPASGVKDQKGHNGGARRRAWLWEGVAVSVSR